MEKVNIVSKFVKSLELIMLTIEYLAYFIIIISGICYRNLFVKFYLHSSRCNSLLKVLFPNLS